MTLRHMEQQPGASGGRPTRSPEPHIRRAWLYRRGLAGACLLLCLATGLAGCAAAVEQPLAYQPTVLITGANRGIGLEFTRQFSGRGWRVIATARDPGSASELAALAAANRSILVEPLDVTDHAAIDALAGKYRGEPVDILLLNAALGPTPATALSPLAKLDFDTGRKSFSTNAIGPLKMAQAFMDNVAASQRRLVIAMGTDSGSFGASVKKPILYHYKASKTALHMYMYTLSFEAPQRGVSVVILHPGLVGTTPALAKFPGALKTADSVAGLMTVIDGLGSADNGRFIDYQGKDMPW